MHCNPSTQMTAPFVPTDLRALFPKELHQRLENHPTLGSPNAPTPTKPTAKNKYKSKQTNKHTVPDYHPICMQLLDIRQARFHAATTIFYE
jgi:hypothetical protein